MLRGVCEILIGAQQNKFMRDAKLRNESIDSANLHTRSTAYVSEACRSNMVFAVRLDQCKR